jgi:hypothetical protein
LVGTFVHPFVLSFFLWLVGLLVLPSVGWLVRPFVRSFVLWFVCWFARSFVRSFVGWLVRSFVRLFVFLLVGSFFRSLVGRTIVRPAHFPFTASQPHTHGVSHLVAALRLWMKSATFNQASSAAVTLMFRF